MKIEIFRYEIGYKELKTPFKTALRVVDKLEYISLSIGDNEKTVEAQTAPTLAITGEGMEQICSFLQRFQEECIGKTLHEVKELFKKCSYLRFNTRALLDMALFELELYHKKKRLKTYYNLPLHVKMKTAITISYNPTQVMLEDTKKNLALGMEIFKLKFADDINHAIETIELLNQEISEAIFLIDANQGWNKAQTLEFIEKTSHLSYKLIEQPIDAKELESLKEITQKSKKMILADEAVYTLEDAKKILENGYAGMINIKLMKCGGLDKTKEILEYLRHSGHKCMFGSMLESPLSINHTLYLAFYYRDVVEYLDMDSPLLYKEFPSNLDFIYRGCEITPK